MTNVLGSARQTVGDTGLPATPQVGAEIPHSLPGFGSLMNLPGLGLARQIFPGVAAGLNNRQVSGPNPNILSQLNPANVGQLASFAQSLTQPQMDYMRGLHQQTSPHLPYDFWHQNVGIPHIVSNFQSFPSGFFSPQQLDSLNSLSGGLTLT